MWSRIAGIFSAERRSTAKQRAEEPLRVSPPSAGTNPKHWPASGPEASQTTADETSSIGPTRTSAQTEVTSAPISARDTSKRKVSTTTAEAESARWAAARSRPLVYAHKLRLEPFDNTATGKEMDPQLSDEAGAYQSPTSKQSSVPSPSATEKSAVRSLTAENYLIDDSVQIYEQSSGSASGRSEGDLGTSTSITTQTERNDAAHPPASESTSSSLQSNAPQRNGRFALLQAVAGQLRLAASSCRYLVIVGSVSEGRKLSPVIRSLRAQLSSSELVTVCAAGDFPERTREALQLFGVAVDMELSVPSHLRGLEETRTRMITGFGKMLVELKPEWVVVQGSSAVAAMASIAAYYAHIPVAHVDDGACFHDLDRSDEANPDVLHRLIASLFASVHFAETAWSKELLVREGVPEEAILVTGNTGVDVMHETCAALGLSVGTAALRSSGVVRVLVVAELPETLAHGLPDICRAIRALAMSVPGLYQFVWPLAPGARVAEVVHELLDRVPGVLLSGPATYEQFLHHLSECDLVLTDVQDIQEEAPSFGKPVLLMRQSTERPEALRAGITTLTGVDAASIQSGVRSLARKLSVRHGSITNPFGDGKASSRILDFFEGRQVLEFGRTALPRSIATGEASSNRLLAGSARALSLEA